MGNLKIALWGLISLHTLLLLILPLFYFMPSGSFWEGLAFLLFIVAFSLNLVGCYLFGAFFIFKGEDEYAENVGLIGVWALLGFIFAPLAMNNYAYYAYYKQVSPQIVKLDTTATAKAGRFLKIDKARILEVYTQEKDVQHSRKSGKSGTSYYKVHYKLCPIVPENWREGQPITFFLAYNNDERLEKDFELAYTLQTLITPQYAYQYHKIAEEIIAKNNLQIAGKPVFLELVDVQKRQKAGWWYARLFYGIMIGVWVGLSVLVMLQPKNI